MEKYRPPPKKYPAPEAKRRCHRCNGTGREACPICGGSGQVAKGKDAFGKLQFGQCDGCFGNKSRRCAVCGGEGFIV